MLDREWVEAAWFCLVLVALGVAVYGLTGSTWDKETLRDDERPIDFVGRRW